MERRAHLISAYWGMLPGKLSRGFVSTQPLHFCKDKKLLMYNRKHTTICHMQWSHTRARCFQTAVVGMMGTAWRDDTHRIKYACCMFRTSKCWGAERHRTPERRGFKHLTWFQMVHLQPKTGTQNLCGPKGRLRECPLGNGSDHMIQCCHNSHRVFPHLILNWCFGHRVLGNLSLVLHFYCPIVHYGPQTLRSCVPHHDFGI